MQSSAKGLLSLLFACNNNNSTGELVFLLHFKIEVETPTVRLIQKDDASFNLLVMHDLCILSSESFNFVASCVSVSHNGLRCQS